MKLDKQQTIIIVLAAILLCGFGVLQYIPVIHQRGKICDRMTQQDQLAETLCVQTTMLPELRHQEKELRDALVPITKKIPEGRHFATLWQQIADVMNACNLTNQLVQPGKELKSDQLCSIPLTLECQGSIEQLFAFLKAMEGMERLVRFDQVKLENDSDFKGIVKLYAKASVYYQSDGRGNS